MRDSLKRFLFASTYVPLVSDFPVKPDGTGSLGAYINTIVTFAIGIAGILAVIMIIIGGVQYVSTDSWSNKDDGKKRIQAALGGLILALSCFLILNTIDPNLTKLSFSIDPQSINNLQQNLQATGGSFVLKSVDYVEPGQLSTNGNGSDLSYGGNINSNDPNAPIGVKNNNFGNVKKPGATDWEGTVRYDVHGHAVFDSPESGIRAYMLNLRNQYNGGKFKTINELISYYTSVEKDRAPYVAFIKAKTGFNPYQDAGLVKNGTVDKAVLYPLARAMFEYENGKRIDVSDAQLDASYKRAFGQ